ncbi:MAG: diaminopimelate epimerase [SAR202 cluster bacterium]|nr:diaminopimelate epimerase [SAR202 cluster bacterium]
MEFTKMHGAGNDYVVIDGRDADMDWSALALSTLERHVGIGGDGLLVLMNSAVADVRMRMFNPDGSEAEMCGNGIRCVAKYCFENEFPIADKSSLNVETMDGVKTIEPIWKSGEVVQAIVNMGQPEFMPERIPVTLSDDMSPGPVLDFPIEIDGYTLELSFVSMGNPHAVAFIEMPVDEFPLDLIGPKVEKHTLFPNKVNFSIVNVLKKGSVKARVWERGAGETLACGTGACAIAAVSSLHDYMDGDIDIALRGGSIKITWNNHNAIYMEGPVKEVFRGELPS